MKKHMTTYNTIFIISLAIIIISQTVCNIYNPIGDKCTRYFGIIVLLIMFYLYYLIEPTRK